MGTELTKIWLQYKKTIEFAAGDVAHCTKAEREKILRRTPDDVRTREEAAARCTKVIKGRVHKKTSWESQSAALGEVLLGAWQEESFKETSSRHG